MALTQAGLDRVAGRNTMPRFDTPLDYVRWLESPEHREQFGPLNPGQQREADAIKRNPGGFRLNPTGNGVEIVTHDGRNMVLLGAAIATAGLGGPISGALSGATTGTTATTTGVTGLATTGTTATTAGVTGLATTASRGGRLMDFLRWGAPVAGDLVGAYMGNRANNRATDAQLTASRESLDFLKQQDERDFEQYMEELGYNRAQSEAERARLWGQSDVDRARAEEGRQLMLLREREREGRLTPFRQGAGDAYTQLSSLMRMPQGLQHPPPVSGATTRRG